MQVIITQCCLQVLNSLSGDVAHLVQQAESSSVADLISQLTAESAAGLNWASSETERESALQV